MRETGLQVETRISAALREKKPEVARAQLSELVAEFPENPLFANELAKIKVPAVAVISPQLRILPEQNVPHFTTHLGMMSLGPQDGPVCFLRDPICLSDWGCTSNVIRMSLFEQSCFGRIT